MLAFSLSLGAHTHAPHSTYEEIYVVVAGRVEQGKRKNNLLHQALIDGFMQIASPRIRMIVLSGKILAADLDILFFTQILYWLEMLVRSVGTATNTTLYVTCRRIPSALT